MRGGQNALSHAERNTKLRPNLDNNGSKLYVKVLGPYSQNTQRLKAVEKTPKYKGVSVLTLGHVSKHSTSKSSSYGREKLVLTQLLLLLLVMCLIGPIFRNTATINKSFKNLL